MLRCPACGAEQRADAVFSISADQRPDLRAAVLDSSLQVFPCSACNVAFRLEPRLTYLDVERGLWVVAWPDSDRARWSARAAQAQQMFQRAYGARAGAGAKALGQQLIARTTFGWHALREKIAIQAAGLDDVEVELLKLLLIRQRPVRLSAHRALRLEAADAQRLRFVWLDTARGRVEPAAEVPTSLLLDVALARTDWAGLRGALSESLYVDVQRLMAS